MSCFWKHNWGKWKITSRGEISRQPDFLKEERIKVGESIKQERTCSDCGLTEIKADKIYTV